MAYLIDPPTVFAPIADWRVYLADLEDELSRNPADPDLIEAVADARDHIAAADAGQK